jgi:hypothetical protein
VPTPAPGSKPQASGRFHHDRNPYYGRLAVVLQGDIQAVIGQLIQKGYLKTIGGEYPVLALTPRGEQAIQQKEAIALRLPQSFAPEAVQDAKEKLQAGGTVAYTAKLLAEGLSVEVIAQRRGLTLGTIYGHCAQLIERGTLDVERVVPAGVQAQIQAAIEQVETADSLSAIKALLPEAIDYGMIRCVLAARGETFTKLKVERTSRHSETEIDRAILECVKSLPNRLPRSGVAKLLVGSSSERVEAYQSHPLYNSLDGESRSRVLERVDRLLENGQLQKAENGCLILGDAPTCAPAPPADPVAAFLSSHHPRPLKGIWQVGFALDFHSTFRGAEWERSVIGELVYRLKYEDDRSVLPSLVEHTLDLFAAQPQMTEFEVIVPVPPSTPRPFQPLEAYCQALAQAVGKAVKNCLVKTRPTQPQKEMSTLAQKRANVAGAFAVRGEVAGQRILLVDDLHDSGATLEEITRLLLRHGARQVNVLTWTRTIHVDA